MRRPLAALLALLVASFCASTAPAFGATARDATGETKGAAAVSRSRRLAVDRFKGTGDVKAVRQWVIAALETEVTIDVAPMRLLEKHKDLNDGSPEGYSSIAERLDLLVILYGKVGKSEQGYMLALTVINGKNGKSLGTLAFHGSSIADLRRTIQKELLAEIRPVLERATAGEPEAKPEPEPEPEPKPVMPPPEPKAEPEEKPEPAPKPEPSTAACPWLEVELGGGVAQRQFNWEGEESGALRGYRLEYAPFASGRASYRPFAHRSCSALSGFGVRLGYERTFAITSVVGGQELDTLAFAFDAGFEFEIRLGPVSLTPNAGFVYRHFQLGGNLVPDPKYKLLALGTDGGVHIAWFLIELGGAAHFVLDAGSLQTQSWFPDASGFGYALEGRIGASPTSFLDAFGLVEFESYSFDTNATSPGPGGLATGTFDRYIMVGAGVRFYVPVRAGAK